MSLDAEWKGFVKGRSRPSARASVIDPHWDPAWAARAPLPRDAGTRTSLYLPMRDGTRIAADVTLPSSYRPGDKLPTILRQTRYLRSHEMPSALDFRMSRDAFDIVAPTRERFLARGYAWVDVDVRGSGVSTGSWPGPWSKGEVADGAEVVDYIVRQPWSSGRVGSTGISYEGTTCEMLLANRHEAVVAVAPRFSLLCAYEDVAFPGGAHLSWFTERWARYNRLLDDHRAHEAMAELVYVIASARSREEAFWSPPARALLDRAGPDLTKRLIGTVFGVFHRGGRRVDVDADGSQRARALLDHAKNGDVHELCLLGQFRDDVAPGSEEVAFSTVSPRGNLDAIRASGAAVFSYGGWLDGGYAQSAARRFSSLGRTELLLGPWGHAGFFAHAPGKRTAPAAFPHDVELLRFFDRELRGEGRAESRPVRYFTLVANEWKQASTWPPPNVERERLTITASRALSPEPASEAWLRVQRDPSFGTGERSRWRGLLAGFVPADYPDFTSRVRGQAVFTGPTSASGMVITGHPLVRLKARAEADFVVMAYLAEVSPSGDVTYISEGHLRAIHRALGVPEAGYVPHSPYHSFEQKDALPVERGVLLDLEIGLLPTSYWVRPGHRLALVLTLGDADHFTPLEGASEIELLAGASSVEVPVERG